MFIIREFAREILSVREVYYCGDARRLRGVQIRLLRKSNAGVVRHLKAYVECEWRRLFL